ncbi:MAG: S41 family peptidase [Pseudomonadota bacterium]
MTLFSRACIAILVGLSLGVTLVVGSQLSQPRQVDQARTAEARLLREVLDRVRAEYVDPVDDARLMEAAIRGMVADLDAHSQFLDEDEFDDIRVGATGHYSGVGLEVTLVGHDVTVITPFEGSPADRAGIRAGDIIVAIDDYPADGDELFATIHRMRGEAGTPVTLSVLRPSSEEMLRFELHRQRLQISSVNGRLLAPGLGYVRISQFHEETAMQMQQMLAQLGEENLTPLRGVVLDLRDNPGGLLDAAVDVADLLLDEGMIVSARGRSSEAGFEHHAVRGSIVPDATMIVLVNGASASAAEIVAGALRDNERARLLGTSTFGKGLVQTVMPLSRGQAIKLTTSRYYTPSGDYIQNKGITPDIVVRNEPNGQDKQLQEAQRLISNTTLVLNDTP